MKYSLKTLIDQIGPGHMPSTAYDTSWAARLLGIDAALGHGALEWISEHQLPDGSWGAEVPFYFHLADRPNLMLAVVRITFGFDAIDADNIVRLSPGCIRLVARKTNKSGTEEYHDYYPIGMLEPCRGRSGVPNLYVDKPDDYLIIPWPNSVPQAAVDAVFVVDRKGFQKGEAKLVDDDVFVEVKRLFRQSLGGRPIDLYQNSGSGNGKEFTIGTLHKVIADEVGYPSPSKRIGGC